MPNLRRTAPAKLIPQFENAERRVLDFKPLNLAIAKPKPAGRAADFFLVNPRFRNHAAVKVTAPVDASEMA